MRPAGRLTARQQNRATLARQLLLERREMPVTEAVRKVVALQAQEPASAYLALWGRLSRFEPDELDEAFASGAIVKASLMRTTLHAVHADDYPLFHAAMAPSLRASRLRDPRFTGSGLTVAEIDALEPRLLAASTHPRTSAAMQAWLADHLGHRARRAWWAYRTYAPLHHAPTGGAWSFGRRSSFVAAPSTHPPDRHGAAVAELVRRYLQGFGPAALADIAQYTLLRRALVREALETLDGAVVTLRSVDGDESFDVADGTIPDDVPAPPRLLPMWESILLAYADRGRVIPPAHRPLVIRRNGDVLPTILVDGYVAGVWRALEGTLEVTALRPLPADAWDGLATEAAALLSLLADRDPLVYRRYAHWWDDLPAAEVRRLPG